MKRFFDSIWCVLVTVGLFGAATITALVLFVEGTLPRTVEAVVLLIVPWSVATLAVARICVPRA